MQRFSNRLVALSRGWYLLPVLRTGYIFQDILYLAFRPCSITLMDANERMKTVRKKNNLVLTFQKFPAAAAAWLLCLPSSSHGWVLTSTTPTTYSSIHATMRPCHHPLYQRISTDGFREYHSYRRSSFRQLFTSRPCPSTKRFLSSSTESTQFQSNATTGSTPASSWEEDVGDDDDAGGQDVSGEWTSEADTENEVDDHDELAQSSSSSSPLVEDYEAWSQALDSAYEKLRKKQKSLESEALKAQNIETTVVRAQLLVSNLYLFPKGTRSAMVPDWENGGEEVAVTLDPQYESASAEADALFAQARKLKRGSKVLEPLIADTNLALRTLEDTRLDLLSARISDTEIDEGRLALVKDRLIRSSRQTGLQIPDRSGTTGSEMSKSKEQRRSNAQAELGTPASNVRKLISPGGCTVLVGRNRRGNEYLSLTVARQNDVWMHSRGCPGAHVVIQNRRGGPTPTEEDFQFAADLAIFYSDLRTEARAPVSAAEPKHLLKPRGAPLGAIKVREEWRTFIGRPDQVPDELKEAREQSGISDEYRQEDKAKNRRRNRQAAEDDKARRRRKEKN